ncbi:unnamed protein product [Chondrus crispus]|uniref:RCK C-terminal domain-containing protein n=1 Tax=Chondrus crispus TaxID=2769 RepID=R7QCA6_CHOCR|nr:unnamed protein product [Chondrus crispus]CDF36137.1 unnamed protein product [Chondrus crispus]|eukprot:XP_005715956.1 unnamed protein product [Chondrus crispus]
MSSLRLQGSRSNSNLETGPPPPPLPNPRSSTSVDNPFYAGVQKYHPKFADLLREHGIFKAIGKYTLRFAKDNWGILVFLCVLALGLAMLGIFAFDDISWKAWASYAILSGTLSLLITNALPTAVSMLLGLTVMLVLKIVEPAEAVEGFSNTGVLSVAILFVVAEGIQRTSILVPIFRVLLGKPRFLWEAQLRVMFPVGIISAFLNNTPVVAMLIPVVQSWSRRSSFAISRLLMPLNNAAILGGTITLLGTSTNLVVDGLARQSELLTDDNGQPTGLPIFGITPVGAILFVAGVVYMLATTRLLIRDRGQTGVGAIIRNPREYTVALLVQERSPIVGDTVQEAGLRQLQGLYLVEVTRADGTLIPAVAPDTKIEAGDTLLFAGIVETVTELYHIPGLVPATGQSQKMKIERHHRRLVELVISSSSMLVGKTAKESKFRSRFSAAIIAVHRQGEHVKERIADITLRPGDTLLVETGSEFTLRYGKDSNFALVSEVSGSQPPREDKLHMAISALIAVTMIALATAEVLPLLSAAAGASFLMIATGCLSMRNAARSVDLEVIITIAASFGISKGMEKTGAAEQLANFIVNIFEPIGPIGLLFGIYIGTALLSSVITNNAAVSLMFPVITSILKSKKSSQGETLKLLYTLMIGASSSFSTPIGYQTNLMVHGPGGYTFMDWVIFGVPLQLILGVVGVFTINALSFKA